MAREFYRYNYTQYIKTDYKTIKPERKDIRITLTLKGYFEDPEALPFSVDTTTWSELKVLSPPTHGKYIKKGIYSGKS